ncbi:hypothetical protein V2J09_008261 [Rumex salicifolius]
MDHYNNHQSVSAYEYGLPKSTGGGPYVMPPPPVGYPVRDSQPEGSARPVETRSKGDVVQLCVAVVPLTSAFEEEHSAQLDASDSIIAQKNSNEFLSFLKEKVFY